MSSSEVQVEMQVFDDDTWLPANVSVSKELLQKGCDHTTSKKVQRFVMILGVRLKQHSALPSSTSRLKTVSHFLKLELEGK